MSTSGRSVGGRFPAAGVSQRDSAQHRHVIGEREGREDMSERSEVDEREGIEEREEEREEKRRGNKQMEDRR